MTLQLICATYGSVDDALKVMRHSKQQHRFDRATILAPEFSGKHLDEAFALGIECHGVHSPSMNACWVSELSRFIVCDHVLSVHWDGFIINEKAFDPAFLEYDFIGAPWRRENIPNPNWRVGGGGFILFSRRMAELWPPLLNEHENFDWQVGALYRDKFESLGMKYAPIEVAARFSKECELEDLHVPEGSTWGFHGFQYNREARQPFAKMVYE